MDGWINAGLFVLCPCDGVKLENLNVEEGGDICDIDPRDR